LLSVDVEKTLSAWFDIDSGKAVESKDPFEKL
jgi:hypothetical protein